MRWKFDSFVFTGMLILCGRIAHADDLLTKDYSLSDQNFPAIRVECVANFTEDIHDWLQDVAKYNPAATSKITYKKLSTIEVSVPNFGNLGAADPFLLAARKRAASVGANMLKYESGVETTNTHRIANMTYTAYRVQYGDFPLTGGDLAGFSIKLLSKDRLGIVGVNFGICNGELISSDNPIYKTLGTDAYYVLNGQSYRAGCIVNGRRIEDVAAGASTNLSLIQALGFPPRECQSDFKQQSDSQDNRAPVAVATTSATTRNVGKKPRTLQCDLDNGKHYRKIGDGPWTLYSPPAGQQPDSENKRSCSSHDDPTKSDLENIHAWEQKCLSAVHEN